jgi:hypothetical protein
MKNHTRTLNVAALLLALTVMSPAITRADDTEQTTTSSTTTTAPSEGTISEFAPSSFEIRTTTSAAPIRYSYSKTTTYVDESGNPVSIDTVRSGVPVTVYYNRTGDEMVANKVVVRQAAPATTTQSTTTTTKKSDDD